MGLLFLILKFIGVLLAAVLLAAAAVLLVPVRYRICIRAWDDLAVTGAVSWFFRLFRLQVLYAEGKTQFRLRILGIPIALGEERERRRKKKKRKPKRMRWKRTKEEKFFHEPETIADEEEIRKRQKEEESKNQPAETEIEKRTLPERKDQPAETENKKRTLPERKENSAEVTNINLNKDTEHTSRKKKKRQKKKSHKHVSDVKDGIISGREKLQNIKSMILDETNKNALVFALRELRVLMRHYLPGRASGELVFGIGDPARTGQVLGLICCFPAWARYRIRLTPDFEAESIYAKGEVDMKGHIRCWHFLWSAFRLFKNKNIKKLIRKFRT